MTDIYITVNGKKYTGWLNAKVNAGIDKIARAFALSVTHNFPDFEQMSIKAGDACEVFIDDQKIISGYVDSTPISYTASSVTVTINGRSKTCDLIDCCSPPAKTPIQTQSTWSNTKSSKALAPTPESVTEWQATNIDKIICDLCAPFSVPVIVDTELSQIKTTFACTIGETVAKAIQKLMLIDNLIITDDENGQLIISKVGTNGEATDTLELGINILSASCKHDYSKVFSDVYVYGQKSTSDDETADQGAGSYGHAQSPAIARPRYTHIKLTGQQVTQSCLEKANFEVNFALAKTKEIAVRVQGWLQSDGSIWRPNSLVKYKDHILGYDGIFLIRDVSYSISNSGTFTDLTLIDPLAYKADKVTEKDKSTTKKSGSSTSNADKWKDVRPIG